MRKLDWTEQIYRRKLPIAAYHAIIWQRISIHLHTITFRTLTEGSNDLFRILLDGLEREAVVSSAESVNEVRCTQGSVVAQKIGQMNINGVHAFACVVVDVVYSSKDAVCWVFVCCNESERSYCRSMDMPAP